MYHKIWELIEKKVLKNIEALKIITEYYKQLNANTFENLNEMDYILEKCEYPKLTRNVGSLNGSSSERNGKLVGTEQKVKLSLNEWFL